MIFTTQIRRKSDPEVLHPVVITLDECQYYAPKLGDDTSGPPHSFRLRLKVFTDHNADGIPDVYEQVASNDFEKLFYATAPQLAVVENRLRDDGNLMAGIRIFAKNRVDEWNEEQSSGGTTAIHTDIDDDNP